MKTRTSFSSAPLTTRIAQNDALKGAAGVKFDGGKPRTDLLPPDALLGTAAVFEYGARKYAAHNWRKGIAISRLTGALLRHLFAFMAGEDNDPESGLPHLDHALCSLMMLRSTWAARRDMDDRWKKAKS